jgi:hypothetical protein
MSRAKSDSAEAAPASASDLAAALTEQFSAVAEALKPPKRKTSGEALVEMTQRQFKYPLYQNGIEAVARNCSDDTIRKAASLAPGRYLNDVVEVARTGRDKDQRIFLYYRNRTIDEKMMLRNYFSSFSDLIDKICKEMAARGIAPVA